MNYFRHVGSWPALAGAVCALLAGCGESKKEIASVPPSAIGAWEAAPPFPVTGADPAPGGGCNFDSIDGKDRDLPLISLTRSRPLNVVGWAAIAVAEGVLPVDVALALKASTGARRYAAVTREQREDVARYFGKADLIGAGLRSDIAMADVAPGKYRLEIVMQFDGKFYVCGIAKEVEVAP